MADEAKTAMALQRLAMELRRHYYHLPYELAPDDLIDAGIIVNLDWDERDSLWAQLDPTVTLDAPVGGSPLAVYAEEGPVVTLWSVPGGTWRADWDVDLDGDARSQFLSRLEGVAGRMAAAVAGVVDAHLVAAADLQEDDRVETSEVAREWLAAD